MSVIAVFNQKGGIGKTTTTFNLAGALARATRDPVATDLDPQAHLTLASGVKHLTGAQSLFGLLEHAPPLAMLVREVPPGIRLIPATLDLSRIDALHGAHPGIVCETRVHESVALAESPMHGKDIFAFAPSSQGAVDFRLLAQELDASGFF